MGEKQPLDGQLQSANEPAKPEASRHCGRDRRPCLRSLVCMAVAAVQSERVSEPNSLLTGKLTGKESILGPGIRPDDPANRAAMRVAGRGRSKGATNGTGNFFVGTGNQLAVSGNCQSRFFGLQIRQRHLPIRRSVRGCAFHLRQRHVELDLRQLLRL
jgi:hypothetical protein